MVSSVEQVAIVVGSAWSTAGIKEVAKLQGCGRVGLQEAEGVDRRSVDNPSYLGPFPL